MTFWNLYFYLLLPIPAKENMPLDISKEDVI